MLKEQVDQIIHTKWIITSETEHPLLEDHALAVKDGVIHAILPSDQINKQYQTAHELHYDNHALLPGFINCHTHIAMNLFRGLADDLALMHWLKDYIWPSEQKWVAYDLVYDASQLAMAEMIRSGTTCFNDMYFFPEATAKAADEAGLRAHLGMTIIDVPTAWAKTPDEYFEKGLLFYEAYQDHKLIVPSIAPHSSYAVSLKSLKKVKTLAQKLQLKINIHLQEAPSDVAQCVEKHQRRPLQLLHDMGMVNHDLIAIHMTQINQEDFEILKQFKPNIVHCPESNMKLVSGNCPVQTLLEMGTNVALGTDGAASNNDLDMFGEMRSAAFLGKITAQDPKAINAYEAIKMATINGAKALGIDHLTGSIKTQKSADFITVDLNQIETQPVYQVISQLVYATSRSQVTDVWVAGRQLLKNRILTTLDENAILKKAAAWGNKIKNSL